MKRPWTPGPWEYHSERTSDGRRFFSARDKFYCKFHQTASSNANNAEVIASAKLASKAPEMVEILISLIETSKDYYLKFGFDDFHEIADEAKKLLKSVGWEE